MTKFFQLSNITIALKDGKRKRSGKSQSTDAKSGKNDTKSLAKGLDQIVTQGSNIQANQSLKQLMKLNKKKRRRAGKSLFLFLFFITICM